VPEWRFNGNSFGKERRRPKRKDDMATQITYFVHGTTTDNEQHLATGWLPGELSELGRQQATDLGKMVEDKQFDVVFCSDLQRAIDSAQLGFGDKYEIIQDERLRECNYGDLNGKPHTFKDSMDDYIDQPFPNGESYKDVEKRLRSFVEFLKQNYDGKHIAIVAHQAPQLALDVILRGRTWQQAIAEDWRNRKAWQAGWKYQII
jgi:broad specificity phosphatase PhoE